MGEITHGPSRLHKHCTLALMASVGLSAGCGLAACGPLLARSTALQVDRPTLVSSCAFLATAALAAFSLYRLNRCRRDVAETPSSARPLAGRPPVAALASCCALVMVWALIGMGTPWQAFDAAWLVSRGLEAGLCLSLLCVFLGEEIDPRFARLPAMLAAFCLGGLGPLACAVAQAKGLAVDLRLTSGTLGVALAMLLVGIVHQGIHGPWARRAALASAWFGAGVLCEWGQSLLPWGTLPIEASALQAGCAAAALATLANVQARLPAIGRPTPVQAPAQVRIGEPASQIFSSGRLAAARQRLAS